MTSQFDTWLKQFGLTDCTDVFRRHAIDFDVVQDLSEDDLRELDLPLGHRKQQFIEAVGRMAGDAGKDIGKPGLRINVVHLDRDDEAVHGGGPLATTIGTGEQPRLAPESNANRTLAPSDSSLLCGESKNAVSRLCCLALATISEPNRQLNSYSVRPRELVAPKARGECPTSTATFMGCWRQSRRAIPGLVLETSAITTQPQISI